MIEFDGLLKIGEDDIEALVKLLESKMKEEGLMFHGLEGYVRTWLASYVTLKAEREIVDIFDDFDTAFTIF